MLFRSKEGDPVSQDEIIAEIETDKVVLEVVAPSNGVITKIIKVEGDVVNSAEIIGEFNEVNDIQSEDKTIEEQKENAPQPDKDKQSISKTPKSKSGPAAKKIIAENNLDASLIKASGKDQRITKADVIKIGRAHV